MAALVDPVASIDWWCRPELHDDPVLWRLLDRRGTSAAWAGVEPSQRGDERTVGPSLRTYLRCGDVEVECLDALLRLRTGPSLVRLVRAEAPCVVTHHLGSAAFAGGALAPAIVDLDGHTRATGDGGWATEVHATPDRWRGLVVAAAPAPASVEGLLVEIERADEAAARRTEPVAIITSHRDRVEVTLGVL